MRAAGNEEAKEASIDGRRVRHTFRSAIFWSSLCGSRTQMGNNRKQMVQRVQTETVSKTSGVDQIAHQTQLPDVAAHIVSKQNRK